MWGQPPSAVQRPSLIGPLAFQSARYLSCTILTRPSFLRPVISRSKAPLLLPTVAVVVATLSHLLPPIPQPQAYHNFADHRSWLEIPNFGDVVSNLPFAIVGVWGLIVLFTPNAVKFSDPRERRLYVVMFAGLILTAFGSAYYHLAPDNARLVWDRIPIMIDFMALLSAVIAERVSITAGLWMFPVLQAAGNFDFVATPQVMWGQPPSAVQRPSSIGPLVAGRAANDLRERRSRRRTRRRGYPPRSA